MVFHNTRETPGVRHFEEDDGWKIMMDYEEENCTRIAHKVDENIRFCRSNFQTGPSAPGAPMRFPKPLLEAIVFSEECRGSKKCTVGNVFRPAPAQHITQLGN